LLYTYVKQSASFYFHERAVGLCFRALALPSEKNIGMKFCHQQQASKQGVSSS
jgi:hypothetical protein